MAGMNMEPSCAVNAHATCIFGSECCLDYYFNHCTKEVWACIHGHDQIGIQAGQQPSSQDTRSENFTRKPTLIGCG
jgi:hypothetical protein